MRARICGSHREAGMVTAETAVVLPVLLLVLAGAVAAVTVIGAALRCVDAAREGARAAARGGELAAGTALAGRAAPAGARTTVSGSGADVRVRGSAAGPRSGRCRCGSRCRPRRWRSANPARPGTRDERRATLRGARVRDGLGAGLLHRAR